MPNKLKKRHVVRHGSKPRSETGGVSNPTSATNVGCACGLEAWVPHYAPWVITVVTMVIRVYYVTQKENWWIVHPDEIFQSVEVAFSEVFGYGFRFYEYLPPPENVSTSVEEQEYQHGMYSLRSFIFPYFYILVLKLTQAADVTVSPYTIMRVAHVIVTSLLPLAVYRFTDKLSPCKLISVMASVLCACSVHLSVLGTHTLVNSFLSPLTFFSLTPAASIMATSEKFDNSSENQSCKYRASDRYSKNWFGQNRHPFKQMNGHPANGKHVDINGYGPHGHVDSCNGHLSVHGADDNHVNGVIGHVRVEESCNIKGFVSRDHDHENHTKISKHPPNSSTYSTNIGVSTSKYSRPNIIAEEVTRVFVLYLFSGLVLGITCYIRTDNSLFVFVVATACMCPSVSYKNIRNSSGRIFLVAVGFICGTAIGGLVDLYHYGTLFLSPIQWFNFNIRTNMSSTLFGRSHITWYVEKIFFTDIVTTFLNCLSLVGALLVLFQKTYCTSLERGLSCALLTSGIFLLLVYSCIAHKELRFVHSIVVLLCIVSAFSLHRLIIVSKRLFLSNGQSKGILIFLLVVYVANSYAIFPSPSNTDNSIFVYENSHESADVNTCLHFIGSRNDVSGVVMDTSLYSSGGFTVLNQNVPLLTIIHNEYHLYNPALRYSSLTKIPKGIRILNRFSDYIHQSNTHYFSRLLRKDNVFNYVITYTERISFFSSLEYKIIYKSGVIVIMYRRKVIDRVQTNHEMYDQTAIGSNVTLLEYEGSWLYTGGVYDLAIERLKTAIQIDDTRWRLYQLLGMAYVKSENWEKALEIEKRCFQRHGERKCRSAQARIVLDEHHGNFRTV